MNDHDHLLDQITQYLRTEPVPEMPRALVPDPPAPERLARPGRRYARLALTGTLTGTLAAALAGLALWAFWPPAGDRPVPDIVRRSDGEAHGSVVAIRDVDVTEPLERMASELDAMQAELGQLRRAAALLDAQSKADELLATY